MPGNLSKTRIDNLGKRLRSGSPSKDDLVLLEEFRLTFEPAYEQVVRKLREMKLAPTGRPAKSTSSVISKLKRETTRLSQMQDIAGCRIVVDTMADQDRIIDALRAVFPGSTMFDRRGKSSHGYRAVHLVPYIDGMPIELQVRTTLQHAWAELSEKISDVFDPRLKYGEGPKELRSPLDRISEHIRMEEEEEESLRRLRELDNDNALKDSFEKNEQHLRQRKLELHDLCRELIITLETFRSRV